MEIQQITKDKRDYMYLLLVGRSSGRHGGPVSG